MSHAIRLQLRVDIPASGIAFDDPLLRLPAGTYRISAGLGFKIDEGTCYDDGGHTLGTSIIVRVN